MAYRDLNTMPGRKARLHPQHCGCTSCTAVGGIDRHQRSIVRLQVAVAALCLAVLAAVPALCGVTF